MHWTEFSRMKRDMKLTMAELAHLLCASELRVSKYHKGLIEIPREIEREMHRLFAMYQDGEPFIYPMLRERPKH